MNMSEWSRLEDKRRNKEAEERIVWELSSASEKVEKGGGICYKVAECLNSSGEKVEETLYTEDLVRALAFSAAKAGIIAAEEQVSCNEESRKNMELHDLNSLLFGALFVAVIVAAVLAVALLVLLLR